MGASDEYQTPVWLFDLMGITFDLDVAADALADPNSATPKGTLFQFIREGRPTNVYMPVVLAAYGDDCAEAIRRVGPTRVLAGA